MVGATVVVIRPNGLVSQQETTPAALFDAGPSHSPRVDAGQDAYIELEGVQHDRDFAGLTGYLTSG